MCRAALISGGPRGGRVPGSPSGTGSVPCLRKPIPGLRAADRDSVQTYLCLGGTAHLKGETDKDTDTEVLVECRSLLLWDSWRTPGSQGRLPGGGDIGVALRGSISCPLWGSVGRALGFPLLLLLLLFFLFCFVLLFRAALGAYGSSQARGRIAAAAAGIRAASVTYTPAHSNTGSLTHD